MLKEEEKIASVEEIATDDSVPEESKGLTEVKGIGPKTAIKLIEGGITTPQQLACARSEEIAGILNVSKKVAKDIVNDAMNKFLDKTITLGNYRTAVDHQEKVVKRIPTGSQIFDKIMGGGIPTEAITVFKGEYETGKSEMCYQLAVNCIKYFARKVVWIETESHTFIPARLAEIAKSVGVKIKDDDIIYIDAGQTVTPYNMFLAYERIKRAVEKDSTIDIGLWIIDSFTAPFGILATREQLPDRAREERRHLGFLGHFSNKYNTAIVLTAQVMDIPDPGAQLGEMVKSGHKKKMVGGGAVQHGATYLISLEQKSIKQYEGIVFGAPDVPRTPFRFNITSSGIRDI
jgi:DNA repair protein RadA